MKPVEIPYTKSTQFTKERMFNNPEDSEKRIPRKLKKKRKKQNERQHP